MSTWKFSSRGVAVLASLALAGGAGACGSDDGGESPASKQGSKATTVAAGSSEEAKVKATYGELVEAVYSKDAEAACALMTLKAQKNFGKGKRADCPKQFKIQLDGVSNDRPALYSVRVQGNRAEGRAGTPNTSKYPVPFQKVDGSWRIAGGF
jgi:hypothetical protein